MRGSRKNFTSSKRGHDMKKERKRSSNVRILRFKASAKVRIKEASKDVRGHPPLTTYFFTSGNWRSHVNPRRPLTIRRKTKPNPGKLVTHDEGLTRQRGGAREGTHPTWECLGAFPYLKEVGKNKSTPPGM